MQSDRYNHGVSRYMIMSAKQPESDTQKASMTKASAGDVDYGTHGQGYVNKRRTDQRIAARVHKALGPARTVLNVGAVEV
jgi:hypothetical protein